MRTCASLGTTAIGEGAELPDCALPGWSSDVGRCWSWCSALACIAHYFDGGDDVGMGGEAAQVSALVRADLGRAACMALLNAGKALDHLSEHAVAALENVFWRRAFALGAVSRPGPPRRQSLRSWHPQFIRRASAFSFRLRSTSTVQVRMTVVEGGLGAHHAERVAQHLHRLRAWLPCQRARAAVKGQVHRRPCAG